MSQGKNATVADRFKAVRETIAATCARANRELSDVTMIAVTKTASPEQVREILSLGVTDLGESRVQNLLARIADLTPGAVPVAAPIRTGPSRLPPSSTSAPAAATSPKIRWHMIGHLQRNKVKQALPHVAAIHSVDSLRLAEELDAAGEKMISGKTSAPAKKISVLLQVNASEESQKFGVAVGAALHLGEQIADMPHLQLVGLMTMAAESADEKQARATFARTRELFEEMKWQKIGGSAFKHLSMGMSNDYQAAILEGATLLRLGTSLFGKPAMPELDQDD